METQVAEAMERGRFGLSTSLQYVPTASPDRRAVALAKVAGRYGS